MATTTSNDIIEIIIDQFKDNLPSSMVKEYYYGDVLNPNQHILPVMSIMPLSVDYRLGPTQKDYEDTSIQLRYIISKPRRVMDSQAGAGSMKLLRERMEGRNDDGSYKAETIVGFLRTKFSFPETDTSPRILAQKDFTVNYSSLVDQDFAWRTYEALINFTIQRQIAVNNRS